MEVAFARRACVGKNRRFGNAQLDGEKAYRITGVDGGNVDEMDGESEVAGSRVASAASVEASYTRIGRRGGIWSC